MKSSHLIDFDDPKLTAYALGELSEPERSAVAAAVSADRELQRAVDELRLFSGELSDVLEAELDLMPGEPREQQRRSAMTVINRLYPLAGRRRDRRSYGLFTLAAAGFAVALAVLHEAFPPPARPAPSLALQIEFVERAVPLQAGMAAGPAHGRDEITATGLSAGSFVAAADQPTAILPLGASDRSYRRAREAVEAGHLPRAGDVRVEDFVNAFTYTYDLPLQEAPVVAHVEVAAAPWNPRHRLVRVGLRPAPASVAVRELQVQLRFDPRQVEAYRVVGYENSPAADSGPGADVLPARPITILYEVIPSRAPAPAGPEANLAELRVQWNAAGRSAEAFSAVADDGAAFGRASADFKLAAAAAAFGRALRTGSFNDSVEAENVLRWAEEAARAEPDEQRRQFAQLVRSARTLAAN
jgi:hypothetical protein